jgi:hypothetical protein
MPRSGGTNLLLSVAAVPPSRQDVFLWQAWRVGASLPVCDDHTPNEFGRVNAEAFRPLGDIGAVLLGEWNREDGGALPAHVPQNDLPKLHFQALTFVAAEVNF